MKRRLIREMMERLLHEMEEEDIGVSLLTTFYQNERELDFFREEDQKRVLKIMKKLCDDSRRHKKILEKIISHLGARLDEE